MIKKIGLIGEDPNDTTAVKNLLLRKHLGVVHFKQMIKNKKGYQLDNPRVAAALKIEYEKEHPDFIIFIRDADALPSETKKIKKVEDWFNALNIVVQKKGILLINIYELEALILSDIETFNKLYKTSINYNKKVMYEKEPKEFLIKKTRNGQKVYAESHCPDIFAQLDFDKVLTCSQFYNFYEAFKKKLKPTT